MLYKKKYGGILLIILVYAAAMSLTVPSTAMAQANQLPVLAPIGPKSVNEAANLNFGVSATDAESIPTLTTSLLPTGATFIDNLNGTGTFDWTPTYSQAGIYDVTFYATDDSAAVDSEIVTITVNNINQSPILAAIGPRSTAENLNLNFGVSASDPDMTIPTLTTSALPTGAIFIDNANGTGTFDWTPGFTQAGTYPVTFYASDGSLLDSEIVTITVSDAGNQSPILAAIGPRSTAENLNLNFGVSASDPDGTIPALTTSALPTGATFIDNANGTGTFNWTPDFTQAGVYNVTFYASDGAAIDSETVTITVTDAGNQSPVLAAIGPRSVAEGGNLNFNATASDPDGTASSMSAVNLPVNATFIDNGNGTGTFNFSPDYTQAGILSVTFIASDGFLADSEIVQITVTDVNLPPVLAPIGPRAITETINLNFAVSATDPDLQTPALTTSTLPSGAAFVDSANGVGTFNWTPTFIQSGSYNVTFYASDGSLIDSEVVIITVNDAGNQPPVLDPIGPRTVAENANLNFQITASDLDGTLPTLSAAGLPINATFIDNANGTGAFDFNPDFTQAGIYNITFKAFDGSLVDSEVVQVTVTNVDRPPVLAAIGPQSTTEGTNLNFAISATDPDLQTPILTTSPLPSGATFVDNGGGSGIFDWTPTYIQSGSYNVTFYASDSSLIDSEIVIITVNEAGNQPPILDSIRALSVAEGQTLAKIVTSTDPDGTIPALTTGALPANAGFVDHGDGTGTFTFSPSFVQAGSYSVLFISSDGLLADSELAPITVIEPGNQPPVFVNAPDTSVNEGDSIIVVIHATDPEGSAVSLGVSTTLAGYNFVDSGNGAGVFRYHANFMSAGTYQVRFIATDNAIPPISSIDTMMLTVNDINQPPIIDSVGPFGVRIGRTLTFTITATDATDPNPAYRLYLSASNIPTNSGFVDNGNNTGTFTFNPAIGQAGIYAVRFTATDQGVPALSANRDVQITVVATNNAPVFTVLPGYGTVTEGDTLQFIIRATDAEGQPIVLTMVKGPLHSTFVDSGNGTGLFTFMPSYVQAGLHQAVFEASDGVDVERSNPVIIQVDEAGNQPPVIEAIQAQSVTEGETLYVLITAYDPDEISLTLTADSLPSNSSMADNGNGTWTVRFLPSYLQSGNYTVYLTAYDGTFTVSTSFPITVIEAGNQPPHIINTVNSYTIQEGQKDFSFYVFANDPDSSGKPNMWVTGLPTGATFTVHDSLSRGTFHWTPWYYDSGQYVIKFYASDSLNPALLDSFLVSLIVTNVNMAPAILIPDQNRLVYEGDTLVFRAYAQDIYDSITPIIRFHMLEYVIQTTPTLVTDTFYTPLPNMTFSAYDSGLTAVNVMTFMPDYSQGIPRLPGGEGGQQFIVYWESIDGADTTLSGGYVQRDGFRIFQTNVAPIIDSIRDTSITEGGYLKVFVIGRDYDFDQDGYPPRPKVTVDSTTLPLNATFTGLFSNIKTFEFRPDFTQSGNYAVRFYATDDTLRDTVTLHINVIEAGNQPAAFTVTLADTQVAIIGLPLNNRLTAIDPEHGAVTITSSALPANAVFADSGNGIAGFQFNPISGQLGAIYQVVFIAQDPLAAADTIITHYQVVAFMRGDANSDNRLDVSDIMFLVNYLYKHGRSPASFEAADVNFDQTLNLLDASFLTNYFYKAGPPPPSK